MSSLSTMRTLGERYGSAMGEVMRQTVYRHAAHGRSAARQAPRRAQRAEGERSRTFARLAAMRLERGELRLSATDLSSHLGCAHLTGLEGLAARGRARRPTHSRPLLELLIERGHAHEKGYLEFLRDVQGIANMVAIPE